MELSPITNPSGRLNGSASLIIQEGHMNKNGPVEIAEIPLNKIKLAKNSRMNITDDEIAGLMQSIKEVGLLQPIGVAKSAGGGYEICYGNRRFLAVSKLGRSKIAAVIHQNKKSVENDIQNLTENIQRRNISLSEVGRYVKMLEDAGLRRDEIAVRLGVAKSYVNSCMTAYHEVPVEFRGDLDVKTVNDKKKTPGKISISTAKAIINAGKNYSLTSEQQATLFREAKKNHRFSGANVKKYASALKSGKKNFIADVSKLKHINIAFWMDENEEVRIYNKHCVKGPFKTVNAVFRAILKGEISERVKMENT